MQALLIFDPKVYSMKKFACIKALATYLPTDVELNDGLGDERFISKLGIRSRHIAAKDQSAGDLAFESARKLLEHHSLDRGSIDFILMCTQHPDYQMPTTACQLQSRLGLPQSVGALDYNLGCSGYVYGLALAKGLIEAGLASNVLLLTSSVYNKYINVEDRAIRPLFGDAATATLLSAIESERPRLEAFVFGTDGDRFDSIYIPVGGSRNMPRDNPEVIERDGHGNVHSNYEVHMDGMAVTYFTYRTVPRLVEEILSKAKLEREDIDHYIFHQANRYVMERVQKKCRLEGRPFYCDIEELGNTVSCTVPFGLEKVLSERSTGDLKRVMLCGFGVGLSWCGCIADLSDIENYS